MTAIGNSTQTLPTFEARDIGGSWDIVMRIPHASGNGGATVEQILLITENGGAAPAESVIAQRVCQLLNMSAHIDTEDLFIKGASLKLQTFVERNAEHLGVESELSDRDKDLSDTNEALRRGLNIIGKKFGVSSSSPELVAKAVVDEHEKLQAKFSQADHDLNEHSEAMSQLREHFMIPTDSSPVAVVSAVKEAAESNARTITDRTERLNKAIDQLETVEKLMITAGHHNEGAKLWASVDSLIDGYNDTAQGKRIMELVGENQQLKTSLETSRIGLADAHKNLSAIRFGLEVDTGYDELPSIAATLFDHHNKLKAAHAETAGQLAKADQELATVRGNLHLVGQALKDNGEYPTIVELAHARMEEIRELSSVTLQAKQECGNRASVIDELNEFKTRALVLHDNICDMLGDARGPGDTMIPFAVLFDRLRKEFEAPRNAIITLADNFEVERDNPNNYPDAMAAVYHLMKGLSVAQHKSDQNLRTVLEERQADRSIIGAIDDLLGDKSRPTAPIVAAIRSLVRSHLIATERS